MLHEGIIYSHTSPLHLVIQIRQKKLYVSTTGNKIIQLFPDWYPVPHIDDFESELMGECIFPKIVLTREYYQIHVATDDIPKTAVITPFGFYELLRI